MKRLLWMICFLVLAGLFTGCGQGEEEYADVLANHLRDFNGAYTKEEYEKLLGYEGVKGGSFYGASREILYAYRRGVDYLYGSDSREEEPEGAVSCESISFLLPDQRVKCATLLGEGDLTAGTLPSGWDEVVLYGEDQSLIGAEFTIFLCPPLSSGSNYYPEGDYVGRTFRVSGLQCVDEGQIYFSEELCRQMAGRNAPLGTPQILSSHPMLRIVETDDGTGLIVGTEEPPGLFEQALVEQENYSGVFEDCYPDSSLTGNEAMFSEGFYARHYAVYDQFLMEYYYGKEDGNEKNEACLRQAGEGRHGMVYDSCGEFRMRPYTLENISWGIIRRMQIKDGTFPAGDNVFAVSPEIYEEMILTDFSSSVILRVEKSRCEEVCRQLREEGYSNVVIE